MFQKYLNIFKSWWSALRENQQKILGLRLKNIELAKRLTYPNLIIEATAMCLEKDISWYDYKQLNPSDQNSYYNEAQMLIKGHVLNNEINFAIAGISKFALQENVQNDVKRLEAARSMIYALEKLKINLSAIEPFKPV